MRSINPSPSALVLSHLAFENIGTLGRVLMDHGYRIDTVEPALPSETLPDPSCHDLVVVLGGPIGVYEEESYPYLSREIAFLGERLSVKKPVVGICLGAQMMARALGARVYPSGTHEIGWDLLHLTEEGRNSPMTLLGDGLPMLHWHGDTFDLPTGVCNLASTKSIPHQAFMIDNHALALQFHPEVRKEEFERWLVGHAFEIASRNIEIARLRQQTKEFGADLERRAAAFFSGWLAGAGLI